MSLREIAEHLIGELRVIRDAPVASVVAILFAGTLIWGLLSWRYQGIIDLQDRRLAEYREKLPGATPDEVRARIDGLENRLRLLEPRHLSDDQKRSIGAQGPLPGGMTIPLFIAADGACNDCNRYQADFVGAFQLARGWAVQPKLVFAPGPLLRGGSGISVSVGADVPREAAAVLAAALKAARIDFSAAPPGSGSDGGSVTLIITAPTH